MSKLAPDRSNRAYHGEQSTVNSSQAFGLHDLRSSVDQATVSRYWPLCVVYQLRPLYNTVSSEYPCKYVKSYLIVSDGVTAKTASVIPAPRPAVCVGGMSGAGLRASEEVLTNETTRSADFPLGARISFCHLKKRNHKRTSESASIPLNRS